VLGGKYLSMIGYTLLGFYLFCHFLYLLVQHKF
jgi:hypothetical protein